MKIKIAFDFDGTITKNPYLFSNLINALIMANFDVHIISGTAVEDKERMRDELSDYGVGLSSVTLILPDQYMDIKNTSLWKRDQIDKLKIRAYFENRIETISVINDLCTTFRVL